MCHGTRPQHTRPGSEGVCPPRHNGNSPHEERTGESTRGAMKSPHVIAPIFRNAAPPCEQLAKAGHKRRSRFTTLPAMRGNGAAIGRATTPPRSGSCLLYTSDAADERSSVDLGGRRIIK